MGVKIYFYGTSSNLYPALFASDGTAAGTVEITTSVDTLFEGIGIAGERAVFDVLEPDLGIAGWTLWSTDGTAAGTYQINYTPGMGAGQFFPPSGESISFGNDVLIDCPDLDGFLVSNGLVGGTYTLALPTPPAGFSLRVDPGFADLGDDVVFSATGSDGYQDLWITDGTVAGTHIIYEPAGPALNNEQLRLYSDLTTVGDHVIFTAKNASGDPELWSTDGTTDGTQMLSAPGADAGISYPSDFTAWGDKDLFFGTDASGTTSLFVTDGTSAGTHEVIDSALQGSGTIPEGNIVADDDRAFVITGGFGNAKLWVIDGTAAVTSQIDIPTYFSGDAVALGSSLLFNGENSLNEIGLWISDGTASGTHEISPDNAYFFGVDPSDMVASGDEVFFKGRDAAGNNGLWETDGTAAGTMEVTSSAFYANGVNPSGIIAVEAPTLCFLQGTMIATRAGSVVVEQLSVGDMAQTHSGELRRIVWIGKGRVKVERGRRTAATPVIVRKGALSDNVPNRDLRVTKAHGLYIDGALIPVEFLVNDRSILWDDHAQEVALYHIELETHDVLLANGAPAESYRDDGNRWLFQNANTGWDLPPREPCAPVLTGGPLVDAVWRRLLERSGPRPGVPMTDDADVHLLADGRRVDAAERVGEVCVFRLPKSPSELRIVSRAAAPAALGVARDPRVLGVALGRLVVRKGTRFRVTEASDERLKDGFHAFEADTGFRWTDGDAAIPTELHSGFAAPLEVVLHIGATTRYLDDGRVQQVA